MRDTYPPSVPVVPFVGWVIWCCKLHTFDIDGGGGDLFSTLLILKSVHEHVTYKIRFLTSWVKGQRISWLGHLERMEEDRMPKKIFTEELEGTRRRGRPRKGWREVVERDLQVLGVRRWRYW